jgi:hypothetical protein
VSSTSAKADRGASAGRVLCARMSPHLASLPLWSSCTAPILHLQGSFPAAISRLEAKTTRNFAFITRLATQKINVSHGHWWRLRNALMQDDSSYYTVNTAAVPVEHGLQMVRACVRACVCVWVFVFVRSQYGACLCMWLCLCAGVWGVCVFLWCMCVCALSIWCVPLYGNLCVCVGVACVCV